MVTISYDRESDPEASMCHSSRQWPYIHLPHGSQALHMITVNLSDEPPASASAPEDSSSLFLQEDNPHTVSRLQPAQGVETRRLVPQDV